MEFKVDDVVLFNFNDFVFKLGYWFYFFVEEFYYFWGVNEDIWEWFVVEGEFYWGFEVVYLFVVGVFVNFYVEKFEEFLFWGSVDNFF